MAEQAGAKVIDLNFGCPAKEVTGVMAGSALMREPDLAVELMAAAVAAVRVPVTVKMRLGWDDASRNAPELAARAEAVGIQAVTIHGRTRCQFYKGQAEDHFAVLSLTASLTVPYGSFDNVLLTKEWTPLEPDVVDNKFYVRGLGQIREVAVKGPLEELSLVSVTGR